MKQRLKSCDALMTMFKTNSVGNLEHVERQKRTSAMRCDECEKDKGQTFDVAINYECELCGVKRTHAGGYPQQICNECATERGWCVECTKLLLEYSFTHKNIGMQIERGELVDQGEKDEAEKTEQKIIAKLCGGTVTVLADFLTSQGFEK